MLLKPQDSLQGIEHCLRILARKTAADPARRQLIVEQDNAPRVIAAKILHHIRQRRFVVSQPALAPGQLRLAVHDMQFFRSPITVSHLLAGGENLLLAPFIGRHADAPGQHRHLRPMGLQTHFELRPKHPRLALLGLDHKWIARVRDAEKPGAAT